jgi:adenylate kinase
MLNIVIFGAPGSGKGTQSELLIERYGLYHISTGEVLRAEIAKGSELGKTADSYISKGCLIPDELMIDVLANVLDSNKELTSKGVIFDGFPRTIPQAIALKDMLAQRGTKVHAVVGLEVADDELVERLKRGQESGRADDNLETIKNRLQVYHNQTSPLKQHYTEEGNYYAFEGVGAVQSIFANIAKTLDKLV